ncbi:NAD(P)/FAD-dependent oxidoreductase [Frigidibacter oleivorans]|uniref:NAD(P)/FAD-dependent oxidoreductase n=1 Tax=Frigidibacter oleivorans TaxID=2487129 RepID=UPI00197A847C|nr:NAD(P)/FAD-dependent oxidoreductase [Frigidibacter oleivorans]
MSPTARHPRRDPLARAPDLAATVVIVGGGFAGLACAQALGRAGVDVLLIDRRNHNLFQPLLYQVATAAISPADISEPIRRTLARYRSIRVIMAEATGVEADARRLRLADGRAVIFDRLVLAPGSGYDYFGHDDWRAHAPGLKSVHEARLIRQRLLVAYERAAQVEDGELRRALLTTVIVGGGPTGVEMAGAVAELGRFLTARDFPMLYPDDLRVLLVEAGPRILAAFPEDLATHAAEALHDDRVEIWTGTRVTEIGPDHIVAGGRHVQAGCIVWAAGVKAAPVADWLGVTPGPGGRVAVDPDLSLPGRPEIYLLGDAALCMGADGRPLPALAQVARQQGAHLGRGLARQLKTGAPLQAFRYRNRGDTAVIGRGQAIFDWGRRRLTGRLAWLLWAIVHVALLVNFEKRALVSLQWAMRVATGQRSARLIDETGARSLPASTDDSETGADG